MYQERSIDQRIHMCKVGKTQIFSFSCDEKFVQFFGKLSFSSFFETRYIGTYFIALFILT